MLVAGPLIGALLILVTDAPFWLVNVVAGVVYAVTMPFVALTTAYVYFDARVRDELAAEREPAELPAEIELSPADDGAGPTPTPMPDAARDRGRADGRRPARALDGARAILRTRVEAARADHASVDLGFSLVERDSSIGGGLLAGALAYRLFVLLLPSALLFVSGLGLYADTVDKSPSTVAKEAGLHGLIASQVASTASSSARWIVFIVMVPAVALRARQALPRDRDRARDRLARIRARRRASRRRASACSAPRSWSTFAAAEIVGWIRRHDQLGGLGALLVYLVARRRRLARWSRCSCRTATSAGRRSSRARCSFGVGLLFVNVFNVYVTTRLVEDRANTYGALGIAAALLFSLVLVGRLVVVSAELNASLSDLRATSTRQSEEPRSEPGTPP